MIIFVPRENSPGETRAALTPATVQRLVGMGLEVQVEKGLGERCNHPDSEYESAGAKLTADRNAALGAADFIFRVSKPDIGEIPRIKDGAIHASLLAPFNLPEDNFCHCDALLRFRLRAYSRACSNGLQDNFANLDQMRSSRASWKSSRSIS